MARKPNFDFERQEREKAKAAKKAAKAEAKLGKKDDEAGSGQEADSPVDSSGERPREV